MSTNGRIKLKRLGDQERFKFLGTFEKYGFKYQDRAKIHAVPTILLINVTTPDGDPLTDHLWLNLTKGFASHNILHSGDVLSFYGRVKAYTKGYRGHRLNTPPHLETDYAIGRPTKVTLVKCANPAAHQKWPEENWQIVNLIYEMSASDYQSRQIPKPYPEL